MSKEIKNLIDTVEEENKVRAEFEQTVDVLKEKINRLNFTIKEQKLLIEEQKSKLLEFEEKSPESFKELKDTIAIQKQDLVKRYKDINSLNQQVKELTNKIEDYEKLDSQSKTDEELINAKKLIVQLTEENEQNQDQIKSLKEQLKAKQDSDQISDNQELIDAKKLNFQLMEENGLLRVQIESLKAQIQEATMNAQSEKINLANKEIERLSTELEDYKDKVNYLQAKGKEMADSSKEIEKVKTELVKSQNENEQLKQSLSQLRKKQMLIIPNQAYHQLKVPPNLPKSYQISLFMKVYQLLDEKNKDNVIKFLINNLNSQNNEVKRNIIEILSGLKNDKVYDAFLKLIDDKDWLVRYNSIKAIRKFEEKGEELKNLLKRLSKDADVDVRELAEKSLKEFSNQ